MHEVDDFAQCPYYRKNGKQSVYCEGVQEACGLRLGFAAKKQRNAYRNMFCRKDWAACMVAKMLNRKYDYEP